MSGFNFFDILRGKNSNINQFYSLNDGFAFNRVNQSRIMEEGYISNPDVYAVYSKAARLCADIPILVMDGENPADPRTDQFADFFYNKWNGESGSKEGLYALYTNLFLFGLAYDYAPIESIGYLPSEQWVLPTQRVTPLSINTSFFDPAPGYQFTDNTSIKKILPEEVIIIRYYDPTDVDKSRDGLSPLQSVWNTVEAENNRGSAESALMKNRGVSGFITGKNGGDGYGLIGKAAEAARGVFSRLIGGAEKFNKVEVLEGAVEYTQLGMDSNDLKLVESRFNHIRDICNSLGLSSMLFNDPQSRTHANYNEARKAAYEDFVLPQVRLFIDQYTRNFINGYNEASGNNYSLKIDLANIPVLQPSQDEVKRQLATTLLNELTEEERNSLMIELGLKK